MHLMQTPHALPTPPLTSYFQCHLSPVIDEDAEEGEEEEEYYSYDSQDEEEGDYRDTSTPPFKADMKLAD